MPVKTAAVTVKPGSKTKMKKGSRYECAQCGMALTIDETGSCDFVDCLVCCGKPMKKKQEAARPAQAAPLPRSPWAAPPGAGG